MFMPKLLLSHALLPLACFVLAVFAQNSSNPASQQLQQFLESKPIVPGDNDHLERSAGSHQNGCAHCRTAGPGAARVNNTQINGWMRFDGNEGGAPVYHPNTFNGPRVLGDAVRESTWDVANTTVYRYESGADDNYSQPAIMWSSQLDDGGRQRLVDNISGSLSQTLPRIQEKMVAEFSNVNAAMGEMLQSALAARQGK